MNENKFNEDLKQMSKLLFPDKKEFDKTPAQKFDNEIRRQVVNIKKQRWSRLYPHLSSEMEVEANYKVIADFIREHVRTVGREQAIKDVQTGLNLLHKNFKIHLNEDGIYGENTHSILNEAIKFYSLRAIKMYIRRGIINNLIFETKNNPHIDTDTKVNETIRTLAIESRI